MPDYAVRPCLFEPGVRRTVESVRESADEAFQGMIAIASQGCSYYAALVTTGPARGRVVYISMDGGEPFFVEDADLAAWYERWLDELLAGFKHFWFGRYMPGTEESFAAAARRPDSPRRFDALRAMGQLPALGDDTREVVALRVNDDDASVRGAALWLVKQFSLARSIETHVRHALGDPDPGVRETALEALAATDLPWDRDARAALADTESSVVTGALRLLDKAELLQERDLLPLLESSQPSIRAAAKWPARKLPSVKAFDITLAQLRSAGDDSHRSHLQTLTAQCRHGVLDDERLTMLFELARERIATGGDEPETAAVAALAALARTRDDAFESLLAVTKHVDPFLRFEAAHALGELGRVEAMPALRELAGDPAMPRANSRSTAWSVGENARKAIAKIQERS